MTKAGTLVLGRGFKVPVEIVTDTQAILAKKGAGKSNAAKVMAEAMYDAQVPWVAVDPKGDWWGIRSAADGKGPGLPVVVFGGRHGDVPLEPTAGALIADLVLDQRLTCVLDVSEFSKGDVRRFLTAFGDRLYRQASYEPLHLFLEEAHEYLPQRVMANDAELVGIWQRIVKQGRFKGLGVTLISQRSAALNKDVLTQTDTLIVLRTTSPQDRAAVKAWVDVNSDHLEMIDTLPSLPNGDAWVWTPDNTEEPLRRVTFKLCRTFDSGATPEVGKARKAPATLADVDLAAIKEAMDETIERAKANDPKELRKRLKEAERKLAEAQNHVCASEPEIQYVDRPVPFIPPAIEQMAGRLASIADDLAQQSKGLAGMGLEIGRLTTDTAQEVTNDTAQEVTKLEEAARKYTQTRATGLAPGRGPKPTTPPPRPQMPVTLNSGGVPVKLGKGEHAVLGVLADFHPEPLSKDRVAFLAGYSAKASTIDVILSNLRKGSLVSPGTPIALTEDGLEAAGGVRERPSGEALLQQWMNHPRMGAGERRVLQYLIDAYPEVPSKEALCEGTGYSPDASTIDVILSKLRKLGIVEKGNRKVVDEFYESIS